MRRTQEQGPWQEKELLNEASFMQSPKAINNQAAAQQLVQRMVWAGAALGRSSVREHPTGRTFECAGGTLDGPEGATDLSHLTTRTHSWFKTGQKRHRVSRVTLCRHGHCLLP